MTQHAESEGVVQGEFFTDGSTFVFKLTDTPLSGVGATPTAAFEDLIRAVAAADGLRPKLAELAREQRSEAMRAALVRTTLLGLIVFGVVGGALAGAAALAPRVLGDMVEITTQKLGEWLEAMPPEQEERMNRLLQRLRGVPDEAGTGGGTTNAAELQQVEQ